MPVLGSGCVGAPLLFDPLSFQ
ncbi:hypothetical protein A2U01_0087167, partial [Trifolium medium]|nr:hypothetical protein [Trifolium medium]